ncbi:MAG: ribonuclease III [Pelagibacteraceae bacterium TMED287]|nr:MAG: ribonuclease III [Pelagibacteraceae bacterium TMED287]|tara:strand:+ start:2430 stop:3098 length:669 start_codon:yes stop_codon:yes gene_type:complete
MIENKINNLEEVINIKFKDSTILKRSLVHKSYNSHDNNEKLEFLGDRVIGLILSKELLKMFPNEKEGIIDKKFANLVNKQTCYAIAKKLELKKFMFLGESYKGLKTPDEKIMSDCLEALIGAIFLDKGLKESENFIFNYWKEYLDKSDFTQIDSKTQLQEYCLKQFKKLPTYKINKKSGPQHNPVFNVEVQIPNSKKFSGKGSSKKNAQQSAAKKLLENIKI